jgi:PAS domain S-box-containing protein
MLEVNRLRLQVARNSLVAKVASAIAILVGSLVLIGWWLDIEALKIGFLNIPATMKPNTALCFVLSGVALWFLSWRQVRPAFRNLEPEAKTKNHKVNYLRLSEVCAIAVIVIATLTLSQYIFGGNLGIDELLVGKSSMPLMTLHPARMEWNTALNFLLVGTALEILVYEQNKRTYWYAQLLSLIAAVIALQVIIAYVYKVQVFYSLTTSNIPCMSLYTAILFMVLCIGILWGWAEQGLMKIVISDTYGGLMARRLLVGAIAVPLLLGWLIVEGQRAGQYGPAYAVSIFAVILIVIFAVLVWQSAVIIELLSQQRDRAQATVKAYEQKLRSFVDANVIGILFGDIYGGIQQANDAFLEMVGYSPEDVLAGRLRWNHITPPEYLTLDEQGIAEARANPKGACTPYEKEYICKDGSRIPVLVGYVLKTRGCIGAFLDITERKYTEELLRNQQQWLEAVLNLMPRPLLLIEPGTARVTFANRAADELAGGEFPQGIPAAEYHTAYFCTDAAGNRIPDEQMPGVRVARGESLHGLEMDWHTKNGILSLLIFADTLPAMHGYPATCVLVFQDITNLKQAEKARLLNYQRLQLLFSTASDLLSSQEPLALIDSCFDKLAEQIGLEVYFNYLIDTENAQVMRLASYRGLSPELATEIEWLSLGQAVCGTVAQQRQSICVESVQQLTDTTTELLRSLGITAYYCSPLKAQGKILGTLSFGSRTRTSFTENQKGMMQAVCDQIAIAMERAELIASLQQQTEQLREANRMKDEFLAILSHELRSLPPEQGGQIPAAALTAYARADDRTRAIQEGYQLHLPKPIEPTELATVVASLIGNRQ